MRYIEASLLKHMLRLDARDRLELVNFLKVHALLESTRSRRTLLLTSGLDPLLPIIDLEGEPFVVASHIVDRLETYGSLSSGDQALGLLLSTLSKDAGKDQRQFLLSILKKYRLMPEPAEPPHMPNWKATVDDSSMFEAVIGENTLRSVAFLEQALRASQSVAYITVGDAQGTGFMVSPDLFLTNHHVVAGAHRLSETTIRFNFQIGADGKSNSIEIAHPTIAGFFSCNACLDYALFELPGRPGDTWGYLPLGTSLPKLHQRVNIIQHPAGLPKQISFQNNRVEYVDDTVVQYVTTTMKGSSGSPVLDDDWQVIALHHAGGLLVEPSSKRQYFRNEGIRVSAILDSFSKEVKERIGWQ